MKLSEKLKNILNNIWVGLKIAVLAGFIFLVGWSINRFKKKKEKSKEELKDLDTKIKEQEKKAKDLEKQRLEIEKELKKRKEEAEKKYLK